MRRKNEEELIKLAFGDIDPMESERAKKLLAEDAEAVKLFAGYSEIRDGLKQLHAPAHQLSSERLRDAILKQGLKPERSGLGWKWTFAPLAVAAAAFLITLRMSGGPSTGPIVQIPNESPKTGIEAPLSFDPAPRTAVVTPDPERAAPSIRTSDRVASASRGSRSAGSSHLVRNNRPATPALVAARTPGLSPADFSRSAIDGALPAGALALTGLGTGEEQPIVLIGAESDESTGANRATEVSSPSNVVIGG